MNDVYLLLGSNIDKERNLPAAVRFLAQHLQLVGVSSVYETAPVGTLDQPNFFNAIVHVRTPLDALAIKQDIITPLEEALHRVRQADKNAPRTIDCDIVLFNAEVFEYAGRQIPDPDLLKFPHAAIPLAELKPSFDHPETKEPFATIAERLLAKATEGYDGPAPIWKREDVDLLPAP